MDNTEFLKFGKRTIRQIKLWAWAAAVLPIVALAGLFFVWVFGTDEMLNTAMVVGATTMFTIAVTWWWWALHTMYNLLVLWRSTESTVGEVRVDLKEIKKSIREFFLLKR
jgi:hypothetical protein